MEEWRSVPDYNGLYQVSNRGIIISVDRMERWGLFNRFRKGRTLNQRIDRYGYATVVLTKNGISKHFTSHKVVAISFLENNDRLPQINHINGIKTDNRVDNLEWVTAKSNIQHAINNGLRKERFGVNNDKSIPVMAVKDMSIIEFPSFRECAEYIGVSTCRVWNCYKRNISVNGFNIYKI